MPSTDTDKEQHEKVPWNNSYHMELDICSNVGQCSVVVVGKGGACLRIYSLNVYIIVTVQYNIILYYTMYTMYTMYNIYLYIYFNTKCSRFSLKKHLSLMKKFIYFYMYSI